MKLGGRQRDFMIVCFLVRKKNSLKRSLTRRGTKMGYGFVFYWPCISI